MATQLKRDWREKLYFLPLCLSLTDIFIHFVAAPLLLQSFSISVSQHPLAPNVDHMVWVVQQWLSLDWGSRKHGKCSVHKSGCFSSLKRLLKTRRIPGESTSVLFLITKFVLERNTFNSTVLKRVYDSYWKPKIPFCLPCSITVTKWGPPRYYPQQNESLAS